MWMSSSAALQWGAAQLLSWKLGACFFPEVIEIDYLYTKRPTFLMHQMLIVNTPTKKHWLLMFSAEVPIATNLCSCSRSCIAFGPKNRSIGAAAKSQVSVQFGWKQFQWSKIRLSQAFSYVKLKRALNWLPSVCDKQLNLIQLFSL